jgi:prepilin-type N-terminal cleavage/methylation domain-containing protein
MAERSIRNAVRDDSGFSLVELIIAMAIFSIFITILLASILGITRASNKAQVVSQTSTGVLSVFQTLDRQIRYADAINYQGAGPTGIQYIEFRTPAASSPSGVSICTQWRFVPTTKVIQSRTWNEGATPGTVWMTNLANVVNDGGANYPFQLLPASAAVGASLFQQLKLTVDAGNSPVSGASITTTFVARNSTASPSNASTLVAGVSDTPVCWTGTVRP